MLFGTFQLLDKKMLKKNGKKRETQFLNETIAHNAVNEIAPLTQQKYPIITSYIISIKGFNKEFQSLKNDEENKGLLFSLESEQKVLIKNLKIKEGN
jgi:hypothetical protein